MPRHRKPRLALWRFASCDGCQRSLLDLEDDLLAIGEAVEIGELRALSSAALPGPYDLSLVEGSITTPEDAVRIREVRRVSRKLVTIGACATAGGIQALRNFRDARELASLVYARPGYIDTLATSTAIAEHVPVDFELRGCPIDRRQLLEVLAAMLTGRRPAVPDHSVCVECKLRGAVCVMALGTPCLGPMTQAGCGALCPTFARGCYGCFGPSEAAHPGGLAAMGRVLRAHDVSEEALVRAWRGFAANAPALRQAGDEAERIAATHRPGPAEPRLVEARAAVAAAAPTRSPPGATPPPSRPPGRPAGGP